MKTVLFFLAFTAALYASQNTGLYRSFEEFSAKSPALPDTFFVEAVEELENLSGSYFKLTYKSPRSSKNRKWNRVKDGKLWGYRDSTTLYYSYRGYLCPTVKNDSLACFRGLHEVNDVDGNGDDFRDEVLIVIDLKKNKLKHVTRHYLKKLLASNPALLKEYNGSKKSVKREEDFLKKFIIGTKK